MEIEAQRRLATRSRLFATRWKRMSAKKSCLDIPTISETARRDDIWVSASRSLKRATRNSFQPRINWNKLSFPSNTKQ
jgi:hypothetical protein